MIKILFFGDVVGECGVSLMEKKLPQLRKKYGADLVIVNGENSAVGNGMSSESSERLYDCGADIITGGNHTWKRKEVYRRLDDEGYLVRPANYPADAPHEYARLRVYGTPDSASRMRGKDSEKRTRKIRYCSV